MKILITGGCGFIGCNAAFALAQRGHRVELLDNLSRPGSELNLDWLRQSAPIQFHRGDIRDNAFLTDLIKPAKYDLILHLAGQVAVTTSIKDPASDFANNAYGTLNLLEAIRLYSAETIFIYSSTNKVYGKLENLIVEECPTRYLLRDLPKGIPESQPVDFHSPYGCSKGAADQYTIDYARIYKLRTVNFRQSCIYGTRQFGVEDQGWVAWFALAHHFGRPITVYGTGKQVRDVLFVEDLINGYLAAAEKIDSVAGATFNIGGGSGNAISILDLFVLLREQTGHEVRYKTAEARPGDQPVYISDTTKAQQLLGWEPKVSVTNGLQRLLNWIQGNKAILQPILIGDRR